VAAAAADRASARSAARERAARGWRWPLHWARAQLARLAQRRRFEAELFQEAVLEGELRSHSQPVRQARLRELYWMGQMGPVKRALYSLNQLKVQAPPPLPAVWCTTLVWVITVVYISFIALYVVLFGMRRGSGLSWRWFSTVLTQVLQEIFVSGPLQIWAVRTVIPRLLSADISRLQLKEQARRAWDRGLATVWAAVHVEGAVAAGGAAAAAGGGAAAAGVASDEEEQRATSSSSEATAAAAAAAAGAAGAAAAAGAAGGSKSTWLSRRASSVQANFAKKQQKEAAEAKERRHAKPPVEGDGLHAAISYALCRDAELRAAAARHLQRWLQAEGAREHPPAPAPAAVPAELVRDDTGLRCLFGVGEAQWVFAQQQAGGGAGEYVSRKQQPLELKDLSKVEEDNKQAQQNESLELSQRDDTSVTVTDL
jgi:hypothetical protein